MIFNTIKELKSQNKTIGIVFSAFDLFHAGHIAMLAEARNHCDYLIAALQTDPTIDRPATKNLGGLGISTEKIKCSKKRTKQS